jgi:hypothetical protein
MRNLYLVREVALTDGQRRLRILAKHQKKRLHHYPVLIVAGEKGEIAKEGWGEHFHKTHNAERDSPWLQTLSANGTRTRPRTNAHATENGWVGFEPSAPVPLWSAVPPCGLGLGASRFGEQTAALRIRAPLPTLPFLCKKVKVYGVSPRKL